MTVVNVSLPLVYGARVKVNFATTMRCAVRGIHLPLGSIHNVRSKVALDNLADLLVTYVMHSEARQTFLVSNEKYVSITKLLRCTAQIMGKKTLLLSVLTFVLEMSDALLGKRAVVQSLCRSLQVDIYKSRRILGWTSHLTLDQGLNKAVEGMKQ